MTAMLRIFLTVLVLAATGPSISVARPDTRDLNAFRDEFGAFCRAKWQDETFHNRLCQSDNDLAERMLMAVQKIETGRSHLDLRPAPPIVPGAGPMNEYLLVAEQLKFLCGGPATEDDKLLDATCGLRDRIKTILVQRGFCYGMRGQREADWLWHKCTSRSLR
jgi:hypothetical protein